MKLNQLDKGRLDALRDKLYTNMVNADAISYFIELSIESLDDDINKLADEVTEHYVEVYGITPTLNTSKISSKLIKDDPYFKAVNFDKKQVGRWLLDHNHISSHEVMVIDETYNKDDNEITKLVTLEEEVDVPVIVEKGKIWMSVVPHEIVTMRKPIADVSKSTLVLGVGLGYFAYHAARKKEVSKVVIVEKDEHAITIFSDHILPQFEESIRGKIRVVRADAFIYLQDLEEDFDHVFVDIYRSADDGLDLYYSLLPYERKYQKTKFSYWIEESLLTYFRRLLISLLCDIYYENIDENIDEPIYKDTIKFLQSRNITSYEEIEDLLRPDRLKNLIREISSSQ